MDTISITCIINNISRFIHLVSSQTMKAMPIQKDYRQLVGVLKLLKAVLDEIVDYKVPIDEFLYKECEELDVAVNETREFIENWSPNMSKIYSVSNILTPSPPPPPEKRGNNLLGTHYSKGMIF